MRDSVSTETKIQDDILKLIIEYKKALKTRYRGDAIKVLIEKGHDLKNGDPNIKPKYLDSFDNQEGRVGFSVTKALDSVVKGYAGIHNIEFQQAYFEYICCGLEKVNGKKPV